MSCEDRTQEFFALARALGGSTDGRDGGLGAGVGGNIGGRYGIDNSEAAADPSTEGLRNFHQTAAGISRDIAATSAMLGELTNLVKRRGLFVDDSERTNYLVLQIKQNVEGLNGRLDEANADIQRQRRRLGKSTHQAGQEATNLVGQLREEFVRATKGFKDVLQERTDRLRETTDRKMRVFGGDDQNRSKNSPGPSANSASNVFQGDGDLISLGNKPMVYGVEGAPLLGHQDGNNASGSALGTMAATPMLDLTSALGGQTSTDSSSQLPRPHGLGALYSNNPSNDGGVRYRHSSSSGALPQGMSGSVPTFSGSVSSYNNSSSGASSSLPPLTPLDIQRMEAESGQSQMMQLIPDQDYLKDRADAMTQVESNIVELGTIFNKLAVMVNEHKELVGRIEDNVDDAEQNVNFSMAALTDTLQNLQTNKALMMRIMGVVVLFIILFVVFFA